MTGDWRIAFARLNAAPLEQQKLAETPGGFRWEFPKPTLPRDHPLFGPLLKVYAAHTEINSLHLDTERVRESDTYTTRLAYDPHSRKQVARIVGSLEIEDLWSVRVGEIAHNLRSALDSLVWQLSRRSGRIPDTDVGFPICKSSDSFRRTAFAVKKTTNQVTGPLALVAPAYRARIRRMQPYQTGDYRKDPLWMLHCLNIHDKHNVILFMEPRIGSISLDTSNSPMPANITWSNVGEPFVDGTEVMSFDPVPNAEVKAKATLTVRFDDGCEAVAGLPVSFFLMKMEWRVREILDAFRDAFPDA